MSTETSPEGTATPPRTADATELDPDAIEEFAGRVVGVLSDAFLALSTSIGHRVGLFDVMADLGPATSERIAEAAGLNERYVREWLGAVTTGRFVDFDPIAGTYFLPPAHAAVLTRSAGSDNLARVAQTVGLLAQVEGPVVRCFREGGGVPYSEFPEFHRLMAEDSAAVHDAGLLDVTVPLVPGLAERLVAGIDVADVGCGSGHAMNLLARAYPNSSFVGFDVSDEAVAAARAEAESWGLTNVRFEVRDVRDLSGTGPFGLITAFDAIHDQAHPGEVLGQIADRLEDDGVFLMVDIRASSNLHENLALPHGPFLYTVSTMHCMTVSLAQGGDGLGTVWGEQLALQMLADVGFDDVIIGKVESDPINSYYIARR